MIDGIPALLRGGIDELGDFAAEEDGHFVLDLAMAVEHQANDVARTFPADRLESGLRNAGAAEIGAVQQLLRQEDGDIPAVVLRIKVGIYGRSLGQLGVERAPGDSNRQRDRQEHCPKAPAKIRPDLAHLDPSLRAVPGSTIAK